MAWDYAELSKTAKAAGGPEKLIGIIEQGAKEIGRAEGQASMYPWLLVTVVGTFSIAAAVFKFREHLKAKRAITQDVVNQAKAELTQGINEYNAEHSNEIYHEES